MGTWLSVLDSQKCPETNASLTIPCVLFGIEADVSLLFARLSLQAHWDDRWMNLLSLNPSHTLRNDICLT